MITDKIQEKLISKKQVKELWALPPNNKMPSDSTIWHYTNQGKIPKPIRIGHINLYKREEVIRLRNQALQMD
ncbi:MAG: hypothetical protein IJR46_04060 [Neisseriaceae bacterium]|nr:hypothetical protein [Neisseriaceae bacterium]